jgi:hypothetical protein
LRDREAEVVTSMLQLTRKYLSQEYPIFPQF